MILVNNRRTFAVDGRLLPIYVARLANNYVSKSCSTVPSSCIRPSSTFSYRFHRASLRIVYEHVPTRFSVPFLFNIDSSIDSNMIHILYTRF
ncbi:hypothetical protein H5410_000446 [Solanum commersonii]|uniref:Uncharacterized protein n=1 Tax=Solanum commersonii TaxID=4109 RepID=A0A9J6AWI9_SOLCO|nr:hypothetical protein H5410_000446 [Solanum commersonii]